MRFLFIITSRNFIKTHNSKSEKESKRHERVPDRREGKTEVPGGVVV